MTLYIEKVVKQNGTSVSCISYELLWISFDPQNINTHLIWNINYNKSMIEKLNMGMILKPQEVKKKLKK